MDRPIKILIVEDEAITAMFLKMELEQEGYSVCNVVATGEKAISSAHNDDPDVILMDIRLAGEMDGIEAARRIQMSTQIPIIFMTGYDEKEVRQRASALEPFGYFTKPIKVHDILPLLESVRK